MFYKFNYIKLSDIITGLKIISNLLNPNSSYTAMISNPLKPGKNVHFYVRRRLNQTLFLSLSLSLSLEKKKESNLDTAQFYTLSYNSNPNEFRPRCIPPTPEITAKQSDSTRRFNPPRAPLTDLFNRVEKRNNPRYNVTREKETVRRER